MKMLSAIADGFRQGVHFRRIALYTLTIQLFLAAMTAVLTYNYIQGSIGASTNLFKIMDGYNHDVFQDLLRFESTGWTMIKTFSWAIFLLYLLIGPFIVGGTLNAFSTQEDHWSVFWKGGSRFYGKFLRLNAIVLAFLSVFLMAFIFIGMSFMNFGLEYFLTELPVLCFWGFIAVLYLLIGIILVNTSTLAKWKIMHEKIRIWKAFVAGFLEVRKQLFYFVMLGVLFLCLSAVLALIVNWFINLIPESGFLLVIIALILQLIAIFVRVILRNSYYGAILAK
jgi:hypothetical protein